MKLRRDAPAVILGMVAFALSGLAYSANATFAAQMAGVESEKYALVRSIVEFNIQGAQDRALARAEMLADTVAVRDALATRDRERLLAETQPLFATQRDKYGLEQMQFVTPDNLSFLRVHKPDAFGDDLSTFRPIIVAANQTRANQKGISLTRTGPAIMGVVPIEDATGAPAGLIELGLDFGPVLDKLKSAYGFDSTFYVKEEPLRRIATSVDPAALDEHNRVGEYLKFHSTNWDLMKTLVGGDDLAKVDGEPIQYVRDSLGVPYGVVMVSLHNAAGDPIGIISASRNFSDTRGATGRATVNLVAGVLVGLIVVAGAVFVSIRGFLLRPVEALSAGLGALANGAPGPSVDSEGFCAELESLAEHYETLRKSAETARAAEAAGKPEPAGAA